MKPPWGRGQFEWEPFACKDQLTMKCKWGGKRSDWFPVLLDLLALKLKLVILKQKLADLDLEIKHFLFSSYLWVSRHVPVQCFARDESHTSGQPARDLHLNNKELANFWMRSIGRQKTGCGMFSMIYARVISHAGEPFWRARASLHFRWVKFRRKHKTAESLKSFHVCGWMWMSTLFFRSGAFVFLSVHSSNPFLVYGKRR